MANSLRRVAASWLVTLQGDNVSEADRAAFKAWIDADARHRAEFDRVAAAVDELRQLGPALGEAELETSASPGVADSWLPAPAFAAALAASALIVAGWWGFAPTSVSTRLGEQRHLALLDGSHIELNTDSAIVYRRVDLAFGPLRKLRLVRGEAFFDIARDERRPFEVAADGALVRVLGTRFSLDVARRPDLTVLVSEGAVSVRRLGSPTHAGETVEAGQVLLLAGGIFERTLLQSRELERRLAWRSGMLQFDGQPLSNVTAEVARHTGAEFRFADAEIAREPFVAYFRANDLDGFLAALQRTDELRIDRRGKVIVIARAQEAP